MKKKAPSLPLKPKDVSEQPKSAPPSKGQKKKLSLGLTSFILAMITLIAYIILTPLGTAMIEPYSTPEGIEQPSQESLEAMTSLAAIFLIIFFINLIGFILGMVGSFSKKQKRSYSIIGAIINGIVLITFLIMIIMVWSS
ncbi:hypothetical protein [Paenibacillus dakarensis]|uniref:hypothetical protein n=1 Tax=Paenibacillus dakarensis TaxID=1527293 RepID=UPI0006D54B73|nr:hypothetical protein [Paenibacillus dakarensis]